MSDNKVELILQAKDLAIETVKRLNDALGEIPDKTDKAGKASSRLAGIFKSVKENFTALHFAITDGMEAIGKIGEFAKLGAEALQAEEAFNNVTASYQVNGDKLIEKMKEVSAHIIDDSDLMMRSTKALQQGLDPQQIIDLLEVARGAARVAGKDISTAFDDITNSVANQATRSLKLYGIIIDNNKAFEDYAKKLGITKDALTEQQQSQALANAAIAEGRRQLEALGPMTMNAAEKIQMASAQMNELKETIGKGVLVGLQFLTGVIYGAAAAAQFMAGGLMKVESAMLRVAGQQEASLVLAEMAKAE
jgi:hypothetical protein